MQIINCWDIQVWDGGDRHHHKYYVATKEAADTWMKRNTYDHISERKIIVFDNLDEISEYRTGEARKRALSKLTEEEKFALGVK